MLALLNILQLEATYWCKLGEDVGLKDLGLIKKVQTFLKVS
jgi:hypothetical protein